MSEFKPVKPFGNLPIISLVPDFERAFLKAFGPEGTHSLQGAKRVGGTGASHAGSHWQRVAAPARVVLDDYGARDGVIVSMTGKQLKIWTPELGMFVVDANAASPSDAKVQWDREHAESLTPVKGSLVNVRRPDDKSQWFARLDESLDDKAPTDTVRVVKGTLGRKAETIEVTRQDITGPHIPTKIKAEDGSFVKDAVSRRRASASLLQAALSPAAKWRNAPAIEWVHSLKRGRQAEIAEKEAAWFGEHQDDVIRIAVNVAMRSGLTDANRVEDVVSEAFYGALSGLRLYWKRSAKQRHLVTRKLADRALRQPGETRTRAEIEKDFGSLSDGELETHRALWRAFSKARSAVINLSFDKNQVEVEDWDSFGDDDEADSVYAGDYESDDLDNHHSSTSPHNISKARVVDIIQTDIADAANLSLGARYLLREALLRHWEITDVVGQTHISERDAADIARVLREEYGAEHATPESIPGMWLYVKNRLRDAVKANPALLADLRGENGHEKLAKSLFISEIIALQGNQRVTQLLPRLRKSFDIFKHPHGYHGYFARVYHAPDTGGGGKRKPHPDDWLNPAKKAENPVLEPAMQQAVDGFQHLLDKGTLQGPMGLKWVVKPEHFLKLICAKLSNPFSSPYDEPDLKGLSADLPDVTYLNAFDLAAQGKLKSNNIEGFEPERVAALYLLPQLIEDPDFILQEIREPRRGREDKFIFVRTFEAKGRYFMVAFQFDKLERLLRPVSFHPHAPNENDTQRFKALWSAPKMEWGKQNSPRPL